MKITILTVGKLKERFFTEAVSEYSKRLSKYCKLEILEVIDEKTPDKASTAEEAQIKEREGSRLLKQIPESAYVLALAIDGTQMDSVSFSKKIENLGMMGKSHLIFLIGGSLGLADSVLLRADEKISFSKMTFPHQLMRVILLEQIYRGYRIMKGEPYHK